MLWLKTPNGRKPAIDILADLSSRLRAKPPFERRVAIALSGQSDATDAVAMLLGLREAGYRTGDIPEDGAALLARLPRITDEETLPFAEYAAFFAGLAPEMQRRVTERWGAAERDSFFRPGRLDCGRFAIPGLRCGNVAVLVHPAFDSPAEPSHDPTPPHSHIAMYAWLADSFRADAAVDLGRQDISRWIAALAEQA